MKDNNENNYWKELKQLKPFLSTEKRWIVLNCITSFFEGIVMIYLSYAIRKLTDMASNKQVKEFKFFVVITILVVAVNVIIIYISRYSGLRYKTRFMLNARNYIVSHIMDMQVVSKEKYHSGDMVSRINNDMKLVSEIIGAISSLVVNPVMFLGAFIYMYLISWKLLFASVVLIPFSGYLFNRVSKPIESNSKKIMEDTAKVNSLAKDTIKGVYVLKAFNLKHILFSKYKGTMEEIVRRGISIEKINANLGRLFLTLRYIPQLVIPLLGGYLAINREITLGQLLASATLIWYVFIPVETLLGLKKQIRESIPAVQRILEILNEPEESKGNRNFIPKEDSAAIRFSKVSYGYDEDNKVIKDLSFEIARGTVTALVGPSGCGKTTVLKLLCGFYNVSKGEIEIFGNGLQEINPLYARNNIAFVSQSIYLFPTTIRESIAYGKLNSSMEEIMRAAKMANAHDFIMALPHKYNTVIGEGKTKLSGGEQQRISLARAILKDAPILLLDEATSALDVESESLVQKSLKEFMMNRTVLVVAHRMSTIKNANRVLVMNDGTIVESGNHEELMERDSFYKKLYLKQFDYENSVN